MGLPKDLVVSVSGIRGRVGVDLDPQLIAGFAAAFGTYVRKRGWGDHLAIARDSRPSGPAYVRAATAGLLSVGCRVSDLGLVPTPTALLEIQERGLSGGIVVTASHNPKEWNALKLASPDGAFLTPDQGGEFVEMLRRGTRPDYLQDGFGEAVEVPGAVERHIQRILGLDLVRPEIIVASRFKVVLDCARGAGGVIVPQLLERLGCEYVGIELEPDGEFSREPEPIPPNLGKLCERVREEGADLGMAVDPDVDRLALVDGGGVPIGEDYTLALAVRLLLRHRTGPVVANLSTSQIVEEMAREAGAPYRQSPVGEANVVALMREVGAVIGGEGNGGVVLPEVHFTRDAPLAVALILQLLAETKEGLHQIVARMPRFTIVKDRLEIRDLDLDDAVEALRSRYPGAQVDRRDGIHLRWRDRYTWLHIRPSGTEPILRVIAEGRADAEEEVRGLVETAGSIIRQGR